MAPLTRLLCALRDLCGKSVRPPTQDDLGQRGEEMAADFLRRAGYRILAKNYRCRAGEIDLIALRKGTVVFVEVKTRSGVELGDPEEAVNPARRRRLSGAARHYLASRARGQRLDWRFDVIAIVQAPDTPPQIRHIQAAFDPTDR